MNFLLFLLTVSALAYLVCALWLLVVTFRTGIWWGLGSLFLWPVQLVFLIVHWQEARQPFLGVLLSGLATGAAVGAIIATHPEEVAKFQKAYAAQMAAAKGQARPVPDGGAAQVPREAHDLAEGAGNPAVRDPFAAQRAACARHAATLNALYAELSKTRTRLKKGSPEVAAFNVQVAKYQEDVDSLAAEQAQLAALDHGAATPALPPAASALGNPKEAEANAALVKLRAAAAQGDYAAFAETLKKCLADYRRTAAFPQIAATARAMLADSTPDKVAAAVQAQGAAARAESDAAMGRVRAIVNQTPPTVPKPPPHAVIYHYSYHDGAVTPDYTHADLYSTREVNQGEYTYMDAAPGVYYRSAECEFNPQTKFFFTSRDKPKKKLSDAEIAEVVRLYRLIAADEQKVAALPQRLQDAQAAAAALLALNQQLAQSP